MKLVSYRNQEFTEAKDADGVELFTDTNGSFPGRIHPVFVPAAASQQSEDHSQGHRFTDRGAGARTGGRARTAYPKLGPYIDFIEQVLKDDQNAPPKQRHTAMQIYRRLKGSQFATPYSGEYNAVRRYVQRHRQFQAETFVPLTYQPGVRGWSGDFGHIHVDYPDGRKRW